MSKRAEEAALKAYPELAAEWMKVKTLQPMKRAIYKQGYEQAEKNLALTWEDMKLIDELFTEMAFSEPNDSTEWYQELANRFNEKREKK